MAITEATMTIEDLKNNVNMIFDKLNEFSLSQDNTCSHSNQIFMIEEIEEKFKKYEFQLEQFKNLLQKENKNMLKNNFYQKSKNIEDKLILHDKNLLRFIINWIIILKILMF